MEFSPIIAYLDPGTGSIILQLIVGTTVGILYTIKTYWYKILSFFKAEKSSESEVQITDQKETDKPAK